ncbi:MAG: hypothetical protein LBJ23_02760 [Tannerella sp.]|jgi:hypothetical protein|nr:hypothetical protein [Tannerella sp.]
MYSDGKITAILTVWKRSHLEEQLLSLLSQTLPPAVIWVQQTQRHVDVDGIINTYGDRILYTCTEENRGVFGRFESAGRVTTEYTYIIDDDMIPGPAYLENALKACMKHDAIVSPNGRILSPETNLTSVYVGDGDRFQHSFCREDMRVDFGNNAWLFRTEWISHFMKYEPLYRNNGEDIHFSATCKLFGGHNTFIPRQMIPSGAGNTKRNYSFDGFALHGTPGFHQQRANIVNFFRNKGWELAVNSKV